MYTVSMDEWFTHYAAVKLYLRVIYEVINKIGTVAEYPLTVNAEGPVFRRTEDSGLSADDPDHRPHVPVQAEHHSFLAAVIDLCSDGQGWVLTWAQCYKTFYDRNLRVFLVISSFCPW